MMSESTELRFEEDDDASIFIIDEDDVDDEDGEKDDDDVVDSSKLDPDDGRLFPNICDVFDDSIKWLIKLRAGIEPLHCRDKPRVIVFENNRSEAPVYKNCDTHMNSGFIQEGQHLDVVSLLSSSCGRLLRVGADAHRYIQPQTLIAKYVLFVCVFAPTRWGEFSSKVLCQLRTLSQQLSQARNFEMVIVPKMRQNFEGHKAAFDKLLSAFHGRLFVPFEYEAARDQICYRLNFQGTLESILVHLNHEVVQASAFDTVANCYYPLRKTKLKFLSSDWIRPSLTLQETWDKYLSSSLALLLDSSYADPTLRLHNLSSTVTTTVGQLRNNLVGLYIFQGGDKLKSLLNVYNQCRQKGRDFHIVVVFTSLFIAIDPLEFHRVALGELQRLIPNTPWWVLPYNAATCSTLYFLSCAVGEDAMITVGPSRKFFVDVHGGQVLHRYGIQSYPFNREMVVRKYELGAKAVTLHSLLSRGPVNYVLRGDKRVPVAELYDKVVVIYTYFELQCDSYTYKRLSKWYNEIRNQHLDFEAVFVYYAESDSENVKHSSPDIDFLVRPFDPKHSKFFREHKSFFIGNDGHGFPVEGLRPDSTLLFGKGGHLCSIDAVDRFERYGLDAYPYRGGCGDNYLRDEIIDSFALEFDFMGGYGLEKPFVVCL